MGSAARDRRLRRPARFPSFEDEWLRGGPVQRWVPKGLADKPVYVFETGGTTGIPKTRIAFDDFRTDYELFSETLPDEYFPKGANWLMLGPSGPRRLRLAVEHLAQYRGGICFCVDLDPRWVDQADQEGLDGAPRGLQGALHRSGDHDPAGRPRHPCMFTTPKLLEALALRLESMGTTIRKAGHHRHLLRRHRVHAAVDPLRARRAARRRLHDADLRQHADGPGVRARRHGRTNNYKITYYAPQPRAVIEVVDFDDPRQASSATARPAA